jgi:pyruvate/2-oxoglutarate dehydrogenase complex dihydrolipoamide acyltransferase (E2) component
VGHLSPAWSVMGTSEGVALVVPQMGVVEQIVVLDWLVPDGAAVEVGQSVVVVETDKAETELEAPASGRIEILVDVSDEEIPVGSTLARII